MNKERDRIGSQKTLKLLDIPKRVALEHMPSIVLMIRSVGRCYMDARDSAGPDGAPTHKVCLGLNTMVRMAKSSNVQITSQRVCIKK